MDFVGPAAVGGDRHRQGIASEKGDPVGFDQGIDDEGASGLAVPLSSRSSSLLCRVVQARRAG
jgi:hypothetical protein